MPYGYVDMSYIPTGWTDNDMRIQFLRAEDGRKLTAYDRDHNVSEFKAALRRAAERLLAGEAGNVMRVKGTVRSEDGFLFVNAAKTATLAQCRLMTLLPALKTKQRTE